MKKLIILHFMGILIFSFCLITTPLTQEKKEGEDLYTIKQGDTLWDISSKFLKNPFLWPKLWQRNPYIANPHWIHPGQQVRLSPFEESKKEEPQKVVVEEKPIEEKPIEEKPKEVKKEEPPPIEEKPDVVAEIKPVEKKPDVFPEVRTAGFLNDINFKGIGIILDSKEGKHLISQGDIVYLAFKTSRPILIGDKYTIFRASDIIRHPVTDQKVGRKYNIIGNLQIIDQHGNFFTAKIIESFDAILKGDLIQPYYMKDRMEAEERK